MHTRTDRLSAILIDAIVRNYRTQNIRLAADALARNGIALGVALRVLTRPWMRRHMPTASVDSVRRVRGEQLAVIAGRSSARATHSG
ncbi:MAG TPA: hypothetical protein DDX04_05640 [Massilia sp.]|nr:hypothetical protein [Massilia sp.]